MITIKSVLINLFQFMTFMNIIITTDELYVLSIPISID